MMNFVTSLRSSSRAGIQPQTWRSALAATLLVSVAQAPLVDAQSAADRNDIMDRITIASRSQAMSQAFAPGEPPQSAEPTPAAREIGAALTRVAASLRSPAAGAAAQNNVTPRVSQSGTKRLAAPLSAAAARARLAARGKQARVRAQGAATLTVQQHRALQSLSNRLRGNVRANLSAAGTPREIRVDAPSGAGGYQAQGVSGADVLQASVGSNEATARAFLVKNAGLLRLHDPRTELRLVSENTDELGRHQLRYAQQYNSMDVWASGLTVHLNPAGGVDLLNGAFVPTPKKAAALPLVTADAAARLALAEVHQANGRVLGEIRTVIFPRANSSRLAWEVKVVGAIDQHWLVHVDAVNGSVLNAFNEAMSMSASASGADSFGITRNFSVWQQGSNFHLVDTSKQMFDPNSTPPSASSTRGGIVILDARNEPGDPNRDSIPSNDVTSTSLTSGWLPDAVSAAYGFSETYDYFLERHNRNGLDGNGRTILATVRVGQNFPNAFFLSDQQAMFFGDGEPFARALDVVGHELSHGVIATTSNLIYQNQSGALNESFADIFGTLVQARTDNQVDWILGDQLTSERFKRDMQNPSSRQTGLGVPYPDRMSKFIQTNEDNGGVHLNSSIHNRAFYLYAEGLPGAVGLVDAGRVFYRAVTVHLTQRSQFIDARLAAVRSAEELFGAGSNQVTKLKEAFDAVEIFEAPSSPGPTRFPEVDGPDSTIAVAFDNSTFETIIVRREQAAGDGAQGSRLSVFGIAQGKRPVVSGDGSFLAFVDELNDICLMPTDGSAAESCLGFAGTVHAVTMSPDAVLVAFILRDQFGNPDNFINVVNVDSGASATFELISPALDGVSTNSVANADAMDFTSDGRLLIYDALNIIPLQDGSQIGLWSIFAIDLLSGRTLALIPPQPGVDIAFPTVSQSSDRFFTFDAFDQQTGQSTVVAVDLETGRGNALATIASGFGVPGYTGDDSDIVYSQFDSSVPTQFTLLRQPMGADGITPQGQPAVWLPDADFGVIYRRGNYQGAPDVNLVVSQASDAQSVTVGQTFSYRVEVRNTGTDPSTDVVLTDTIPADVMLGSISASQGGCSISGSQVTCNLGVINGGASVNLVIPVTPTSPGNLTLASNVGGAESDRDSNDNSAVSSILVTSSAPPATAPASAVLPGSRSVQVGSLASVFATMLNTDSVALEGCTITPLTNVPAQFFFQTSDPATNSLTGAPNTPVQLGSRGAQSFVLGFTPTAPFAPTEVQLGFDCGNTDVAGIVVGVNTLLLSASNTPVADVVALGATASGDGIVNLPGPSGAAAFAVASVNVGAAATVSVSAEIADQAGALPVTLTICETNPLDGQCLSAPAATVSTAIAANATPTFSIFAQGSGGVPFDPANNRVRVVFSEGGTVRGATSVAIRTQ